jgi:hypothetical protein
VNFLIFFADGKNLSVFEKRFLLSIENHEIRITQALRSERLEMGRSANLAGHVRQRKWISPSMCIALSPIVVSSESEVTQKLVIRKTISNSIILRPIFDETSLNSGII